MNHIIPLAVFLSWCAIVLSVNISAPVIVPNDQSKSAANRQAIESGLLGGGTVVLPVGLVHLDRALLLGPQHSGSTLKGSGPQSILRNSGSAGISENGTLQMGGTGIAYYQSATIQGNAYVLDPNIPGTGLPWDHPSNQPELLKPGNIIYLFAFNSYLSQTPPPRARRGIVSFDAVSRRLVLDGPVMPALTSLKWMAGRPVADVAEGDHTAQLLAAAHAVDFPSGRSVYVTSGPSTANASVGEHRRVLAADPATGLVTLDRAVTRPYTDATLALLNPVADVTVSRLTLAQPINAQANPFFLQFATNLTMDHVYSNDPLATTCCLANCGNATITNCEINGLMLNIGHDTIVDGGLYTQIYGEESSTTTTVRNLIIRANVSQPANGLMWHVSSDRLTISRVRIEGFGTPIPGSGSSNAFNVQGRGLSFSDTTVQMINGVGAGYVQSDGGVLRNLISNTGLQIYAGRGWWLQNCAVPAFDLRPGTTGTAVNCTGMPSSALGWTITP